MSKNGVYDAIIVGAGHNGLVTALYLAKAGWKTLVLERNERVGGAVQSAEITRPGFTHDLYSMNQNLFLASSVYEEFQEDLERHGLQYAISNKPYCNLFPGGESVRVYGDADKTLGLIRDRNSKDAEGWQQLYGHYHKLQEAFLPLYGSPLPSWQMGVKVADAVRKVGAGEVLELSRLLLNSTRELGESFFTTKEMQAVVATWGMHLDFGPDVSGGAQFPLLETFADMEEGMAVPKGGASKMPEALAGLLREYGGEVRTEAEVVRVTTQNGRASGVELADGERLFAKRAVVANLTPTVLFERLLADAPLPTGFRREVKRYEYGPATMMVHLALKDRPRWAAGEEIADFAYVHIAPYIEDLARTYTDALNGTLPASPLLIVGQPTAFDPSRAPNGQHILWLQVRTLPSAIRGDALNQIEARTWDEAKEPVAERVLDKLEAYAPGIRDLILERVVYSPADLERHNPNLVGGDSVGGSHHLRQNYFFRPIQGWSNYKMPLTNLWMVGAATWPGGGTNATSGYLAARSLLSQGSRKALASGAAGAGALALGALAVQRWTRR